MKFLYFVSESDSYSRFVNPDQIISVKVTTTSKFDYLAEIVLAQKQTDSDRGQEIIRIKGNEAKDFHDWLILNSIDCEREIESLEDLAKQEQE